MIKTRVRFNGKEDSFYVEYKWGIWPFKFWAVIYKPKSYSSDDDKIRYFSRFDDARTFAIKKAVDVQIKHKVNEYGPLL